MSFNSLSFILFFAILLLVYAFLPDKHRWKALLLFSLIFYVAAGLDKLVILLTTSLVVYLAAQKMGAIYQAFDAECKKKKLAGKDKSALLVAYKKRCKRILLLALIICVGILCYCKAANVLAEALQSLLHEGFTAKVIVPLGLSYYTFSSVGYLLDIYWRKTTPTYSYPRLLLCMVYFPQIVQGPISRYQRLLPQFETLTRPTYDRLCMGLQLMMWGYFKKMVIADRLLVFVNDVFGNFAGNEGLTFVIALIFGVFQLYADFSGCMDIVYGASEILGIKLDANFDRPFSSKSAAEFWRRWHITLGTWFKDYIYFPMATSPRTIALSWKVRARFGVQAGKTTITLLSLSVVWLLTGLWHGTGWNFVVWGLYFGTIIFLSIALGDQYKKIAQWLKIDTESSFWQHFQMVRTFGIFAVGHLLVVPGSLTNTLAVVKKIFSSFNPWIFWDSSLYTHGLDQSNFYVAVLSILLLLWVDHLHGKMKIRETIQQKPLILRWAIYYAGFFAILIFGMYGPGYDASSFVYANY